MSLQPLYPQLKNLKFYLVIFGDVAIFALAHIAAYLFRFEFLFTHVNLHQVQDVLLWWQIMTR